MKMRVDNVLKMGTKEFINYMDSKPLKSIKRLRTDMKSIKKRSERVCRKYERQ